MSVGGVPHYLDHVEQGRSVAQIVEALYLGKDGGLASECDRLFASRDPAVADLGGVRDQQWPAR